MPSSFSSHNFLILIHIKILRAISITLLMAVLFASSALASQAKKDQSLLWRVESSKGKVSYLFGTVHVDDQRVMNMPDKVKRAFAASSVLMMEIVYDAGVAQQVQSMMFRSDASSLLNDLGEQRFKRILPLLAQNGIPESYADKLKIWAVIITLLAPDNPSGVFLDLALHKKAVNQGKSVAGLETVVSQLGKFEGLTKQEQIKMLDETLVFLPKLKQYYAEMVEIYLDEDLDELVRLSNEGYEDQELSTKFNKLLIEDRNKEMLIVALPRLEQGGAFIAVGVLHLPGDEGLVKLFRDNGYRVLPVLQ